MSPVEDLKNQRRYRLGIFLYVGFLFLGGGCFWAYQFFVKQGNVFWGAQASFTESNRSPVYLRIEQIEGLERNPEEFSWLYPEWEKYLQSQGKRLILLPNNEPSSVPIWFGIYASFSKKPALFAKDGKRSWQYEVDITISRQSEGQAKKIIGSGSQLTAPLLEADTQSSESEHEILNQLTQDVTTPIIQAVER